MNRDRYRRGQPLMALALVMGGWIAMRVAAWDTHGMPGSVAAAPTPVATAIRPQIAAQVPQPEFGEIEASVGTELDRPDALTPARPRAAELLPPQPRPHWPEVPTVNMPQPARADLPARNPAVLAGRQLLWMAAMARLPSPNEIALARDAAPAAPWQPGPAARQPHADEQRWSADGWILWRRSGGAAPAGGLLAPSYGASQAGAVLRYRLSPGSARRPAAYLRVSSALDHARDREAAVGLTARIAPRIPIAVAAELRLSDSSAGQELRPAAFIVTQVAPVRLPHALRGEFYAQVGYVGGTHATGFADGQLRIDRRVAQLGEGEMRLGGGVWGGIQKGASRIDVGPTVILGASLGKVSGSGASMRLSADWRLRVAGNARPESGPALTLSAGF